MDICWTQTFQVILSSTKLQFCFCPILFLHKGRWLKQTRPDVILNLLASSMIQLFLSLEGKFVLCSTFFSLRNHALFLVSFILLKKITAWVPSQIKYSDTVIIGVFVKSDWNGFPKRLLDSINYNYFSPT